MKLLTNCLESEKFVWVNRKPHLSYAKGEFYKSSKLANILSFFFLNESRDHKIEFENES